MCLQDCAAGVMITASHNPKEDNGYKVYWGNGAQIIPPHDSGIAACIDAELTPWETHTSASLDAAEASPLCRTGEALLQEVSDTYFCRMTSLCFHGDTNAEEPARAVYTAMHGVGAQWVTKALETFGHAAYIPVTAQVEPDPTFPTVAFPNPEEGAGALQMAQAAAQEAGVALILANDPDADRLAVAENQAQDLTCAESADWRIFNGNEIGSLLGHWCWTKYAEAGGAPEKAAMLASTVSSKMLGAVAKKEGFTFEETLTGFKWMGNRSEELRAQGTKVLFSYEEAIGFCCGDVVRDKDGVTASAVFMEMATHLRNAHGRSVNEQLGLLCDTYGHFVSSNGYVICKEQSKIDAIFARLRLPNNGYLQPAGYAVASVRDLTTGFDSSTPDNTCTMPSDPSSHMITYTFENGCVATLRTSGTEPKIKYYVEMAGAPGEPRTEVDAETAAMRDAIILEMLEPEKNGLVL